MSEQVKRTRHTPAHGRLARLTQTRLPGDPELVEAQRAVAEIKATRLIEQAVALAPPLAPDVRRRLAEILAGTSDAEQVSA